MAAGGIAIKNKSGRPVTPESIYKRVALVGQPLVGKFTLLNSMGLTYIDGLTEYDRAEYSYLKTKYIENSDLPQKSLVLEVNLTLGNQCLPIQVNTFSGNVFYLEPAIEYLFRNASSVWFMAKSHSFYQGDELSVLEGRVAFCYRYLDLALSVSKRLGSSPSEVPWLIILNRKKGKSADDSFITEHPLVASRKISLRILDAMEDVSPLESYLKSTSLA